MDGRSMKDNGGEGEGYLTSESGWGERTLNISAALLFTKVVFFCCPLVGK